MCRRARYCLTFCGKSSPWSSPVCSDYENPYSRTRLNRSTQRESRTASKPQTPHCTQYPRCIPNYPFICKCQSERIHLCRRALVHSAHTACVSALSGSWHRFCMFTLIFMCRSFDHVVNIQTYWYKQYINISQLQWSSGKPLCHLPFQSQSLSFLSTCLGKALMMFPRPDCRWLRASLKSIMFSSIASLQAHNHAMFYMHCITGEGTRRTASGYSWSWHLSGSLQIGRQAFGQLASKCLIQCSILLLELFHVFTWSSMCPHWVPKCMSCARQQQLVRCTSVSMLLCLRPKLACIQECTAATQAGGSTSIHSTPRSQACIYPSCCLLDCDSQCEASACH